MDIKTINLQSYPVVSTQKYGLPPEQSHEGSYASHPLVSDEIVDCVEVQTNHYRPVPSRQALYPIRTDRCAVEKGTLIDLWI